MNTYISRSFTYACLLTFFVYHVPMYSGGGCGECVATTGPAVLMFTGGCIMGSAADSCTYKCGLGMLLGGSSLYGAACCAAVSVGTYLQCQKWRRAKQERQLQQTDAYQQASPIPQASKFLYNDSHSPLPSSGTPTPPDSPLPRSSAPTAMQTAQPATATTTQLATPPAPIATAQSSPYAALRVQIPQRSTAHRITYYSTPASAPHSQSRR